ncbi:MAG: HDOD domain-containing protein [Desulfonatronovibrio sp. MSAO_Bac4]|nr:MAG: HDOD domain-containing protein [Desulfonatronovibrio sp. MSAO_Bac4]
MTPEQDSSSHDEHSFEPVYVARQPVFDKDMNIWGYELLFRDGKKFNAAQFPDGNIATSKVIMDGFNLAVEVLSTNQKLLINYPEEMIIQGAPMALPPDTAVVEILETVRPTEEILRRCARLKSAGYIIALDDFVGQPGYEPLLDIADLIKIDVLGMDKNQIEMIIEKFRPNSSTRLLAEKVEDLNMFDLCRSLGFDLFQGFFFSRPQIIQGKKLSASQISRLKLLNLLSSPDLDLKLISETIQHDISLSYRLLRYINSPGVGVVHEVKSINQAVNLLGQQKISAWLRVLIMADMSSSQRSGELLFTSLQRARFLELLSSTQDSAPASKDTMFLLGLFSLLDAIMIQPMEELLKNLSLESSIKKALLGDNPELKYWLDLTTACERGHWKEAEEHMQSLDVSPSKTAKLLNNAMLWARKFLDIAQDSPQES